MNFGVAEWIGLSASVATLLSMAGNFYQWRYRLRLQGDLRGRVQGTFNQFYRIAEHGDVIFGRAKSLDIPNELLHEILGRVRSIQGTTEAARHDLIAYAREHLACVPRAEHFARPDPRPLPRTESQKGPGK
jgi:hypothetical protein